MASMASGRRILYDAPGEMVRPLKFTYSALRPHAVIAFTPGLTMRSSSLIVALLLGVGCGSDQGPTTEADAGSGAGQADAGDAGIDVPGDGSGRDASEDWGESSGNGYVFAPYAPDETPVDVTTDRLCVESADPEGAPDKTFITCRSEGSNAQPVPDTAEDGGGLLDLFDRRLSVCRSRVAATLRSERAAERFHLGHHWAEELGLYLQEMGNLAGEQCLALHLGSLIVVINLLLDRHLFRRHGVGDKRRARRRWANNMYGASLIRRRSRRARHT